jgi:hypothetical protein
VDTGFSRQTMLDQNIEHRAKKWLPVFRDKRCSIKT